MANMFGVEIIADIFEVGSIRLNFGLTRHDVQVVHLVHAFEGDSVGRRYNNFTGG